MKTVLMYLFIFLSLVLGGCKINNAGGGSGSEVSAIRVGQVPGVKYQKMVILLKKGDKEGKVFDKNVVQVHDLSRKFARNDHYKVGIILFDNANKKKAETISVDDVSRSRCPFTPVHLTKLENKIEVKVCLADANGRVDATRAPVQASKPEGTNVDLNVCVVDANGKCVQGAPQAGSNLICNIINGGTYDFDRSNVDVVLNCGAAGNKTIDGNSKAIRMEAEVSSGTNGKMIISWIPSLSISSYKNLHTQRDSIADAAFKTELQKTLSQGPIGLVRLTKVEISQASLKQ